MSCNSDRIQATKLDAARRHPRSSRWLGQGLLCRERTSIWNLHRGPSLEGLQWRTLIDGHLDYDRSGMDPSDTLNQAHASAWRAWWSTLRERPITCRTNKGPDRVVRGKPEKP